MYRYDEFDEQFVRHRSAQFREQVERRLKGELREEEFRPLRLQNGVYLQLHAYMLRVAVPYGMLSSKQLRQLASISEKYDRGYGHFTTRQNIQFNWPKLKDIPDILDDLADVEMHAIQTSGNCIRNITSDPWAGAAADELCDPRPICEILRQWSSLNAEFGYLPRKFKFAVTAAKHDRTAMHFHDIGIRIVQNDNGEIGYRISIGGGQGRTPMIGVKLRDFVNETELLPYLQACMRIYNLHGRRDNKYKARIKILVHESGIEDLSQQIETEFTAIMAETDAREAALPSAELKRIEAYFAPPAFEALMDDDSKLQTKLASNSDFARWYEVNTATHKQAGYRIVNISLKPHGGIPGDASAEQMRLVADLADDYAFGEVRVTHRQNLVLAHVQKRNLFALWRILTTQNLAEANFALASDIISCPGLDYCGLATARSIPVAQNLSQRFAELKNIYNIGRLDLNISGCINACGHHHVGHIGILGLEKKGTEFYQLSLGGNAGFHASVGEITGPGFSQDEIVDAVENVVKTYLACRGENEEFSDTYRRIGMAPFKEALYGEKPA